MARILVVDDDAASRKQLVALLSHDGHVTFEARDGLDGLEIARAERPQLVISDILTPSMDGQGFVLQLRSEPALRGTPVIFHTAPYHEREARRLAKVCRFASVLAKPCTAADLLRTIEQLLVGVSESTSQLLTASFDRERLLTMSNRLSDQVGVLAASSGRFRALTELCIDLASERDPHTLLDKVCAGARKLLGARYAVLAVTEEASERGVFCAMSGIASAGELPDPPDIRAGPFGDVLAERRSWRTSGADHQRSRAVLGERYPAASSFLVVPLTSPASAYGWICLADKIGADEFDAEDERLLTLLGAHFGRTYENAMLYVQEQQRAAQLAAEVRAREAAAAALRESEERFRQLQQSAAVKRLERAYSVINGMHPLLMRARERSQLCKEACRLAVERGHFQLAGIAFVDAANGQIEKIVAAGRTPAFANLAQAAWATAREPDVLLAAAIRTRRPAICNDLQTDRVGAHLQATMLEKGYQASAVLPLVIGDVVIGGLMLVAEERNFFDEAEIRLLSELAACISLGLHYVG